MKVILVFNQSKQSMDSCCLFAIRLSIVEFHIIIGGIIRVL